MTSERFKGLLANVIAPGFGQFARKRYLRGMLFLSASAAIFASAVWTVAGPMINNINMLLDNRDQDIATIDINAFTIRAVIILFVWALSYADLLFVGRQLQPPPPPVK